MSDWNCQVVCIESVTKHPNADSLDIIITSLGDYPIVAKLGEWKVGDLCAYVSIDSIVPDTQQFHFLCPRLEGTQVSKYEVGNVPEKYRRIKAKKIRGTYSQGLLVPAPDGFNVDDSVVDHFGLTKWEEDEEDNIPGLPKEKAARGQNEKKPVGWSIPYYDIESVRKHHDLFLPDEEIVLLEKDHGCNFAACHDGDKLWIKSRNFFKRNEITFTDGEGVEQTVLASDPWNEAARAHSLAEKLVKFPMKVFFAECVGLVKGFTYDSEVKDGKRIPGLHFFDVYDPIAGRYLDYDDSLKMIKELGLTPSKELYRGVWTGKEKMCPLAEGQSSWNKNHCREGWVMKSTKERFEPKLNGRFQLKFISEEYSLNK